MATSSGYLSTNPPESDEEPRAGLFFSHDESSERCHQCQFDGILYHADKDRHIAYEIKCYLEREITIEYKQAAYKPKVELMGNISSSPYFGTFHKSSLFSRTIFLVYTKTFEKEPQTKQGVYAIWSLVPHSQELEIIPLLIDFHDQEKPNFHIAWNCHCVRYEPHTELFNYTLKKRLEKGIHKRLYHDEIRRECEKRKMLYHRTSEQTPTYSPNGNESRVATGPPLAHIEVNNSHALTEGNGLHLSGYMSTFSHERSKRMDHVEEDNELESISELSLSDELFSSEHLSYTDSELREHIPVLTSPSSDSRSLQSQRGSTEISDVIVGHTTSTQEQAALCSQNSTKVITHSGDCSNILVPDTLFKTLDGVDSVTLQHQVFAEENSQLSSNSRGKASNDCFREIFSKKQLQARLHNSEISPTKSTSAQGPNLSKGELFHISAKRRALPNHFNGTMNSSFTSELEPSESSLEGHFCDVEEMVKLRTSHVLEWLTVDNASVCSDFEDDEFEIYTNISTQALKQKRSMSLDINKNKTNEVSASFTPARLEVDTCLIEVIDKKASNYVDTQRTKAVDKKAFNYVDTQRTKAVDKKAFNYVDTQRTKAVDTTCNLTNVAESHNTSGEGDSKGNKYKKFRKTIKNLFSRERNKKFSKTVKKSF